MIMIVGGTNKLHVHLSVFQALCGCLVLTENSTHQVVALRNTAIDLYICVHSGYL